MANKRTFGEWMRQNIVTVIFIILCAAFYLLANPILWKSGVSRTPNLGYTLLSLLCLVAKLPIDKCKLRDPVWS